MAEIFAKKRQSLNPICCGNCKSYAQPIGWEDGDPYLYGLCDNSRVNKNWSYSTFALLGREIATECSTSEFEKVYGHTRSTNPIVIRDVEHCCFDHSDLWGLSYEEKINKLREKKNENSRQI